MIAGSLYVQIVNAFSGRPFQSDFHSRRRVDIQGQRDLKLLTEVERNPCATQRSLAKNLGVALGLTNLYIKRLARKGYIKVTTIPSHRIKYLLTPRGISEKSRLTYEYMQYSLSYYRHMRKRFRDTLGRLAEAGVKRIVMYGSGELAELGYLSAQELDFVLLGFVEEQGRGTFLSHRVFPIESLAGLDFDAVVIGDLQGMSTIRERLSRAGVPGNKIVHLLPEDLS